MTSNGVIHQHGLQQPGSPQPSSLAAHSHRENGKQRFPHKGVWGGCHSSLPPAPKSSGFPVSPRAVWSLMRYTAVHSTYVFRCSSLGGHPPHCAFLSLFNLFWRD
uniref:protein O-mannosyl-transferase TMTC1-like isoform X2 n=1 Tax=Ictidomys tridecemlineatus TaxID=43179 RepID=UPI001A9E8B63|nr:protein O-mannosyl-transferase TMTC1-like isoform X2 [Ictidomys tridecemlineatus]XP_040136775.1 protein O-mannosyl-transferase TMTC1-like isoform X2 [Ictidomys tridecemlineatus]